MCEGEAHPYPHTVYQFTAESEECIQNASQIPFFTYYPALSTILIVDYDREKLDLFLDLSFGDVDQDTTCIDLQRGKKWIFNKPILTGQGFVIRMAARA